MLKPDELLKIAEFLKTMAPEFEYLCLIGKPGGPSMMMVVSSLDPIDQVGMATAFIEAGNRIIAKREVPDTKH